MDTLKVGKATFYRNQIIIDKNKDNIIISIDDIDRIEYVKPNILNYLISSTWFGGTYPGRLQIHLNKKIKNTKL